jgi:uncharacterized protein with ParB-like and HNH nuclease domain
MEAQLKTINDQFDGVFYKIPKFQRSYAWGENEWEDFWRTIAERTLEIETSDRKHSPLFMGAIVLQETTPDIFGSKQIDNKFIIDGQQRFVTISVFMAALRDFYFGLETKFYTSWTNDFLLLPLNRTGSDNRIRLTLQKDDHAVYETIIREKTRKEWEDVLSGSHSINKLYKFVWNKLSEGSNSSLESITKDDTDGNDDLDGESDFEVDKSKSEPKQLFDYLGAGTSREWKSTLLFDPEVLTNIIEQQMKFAVIEIQTDDSEIAFEVFETLNAKGQPLAEVDKFRNGFFMLDPDNSDENHNKYWLKMASLATDDEKLSIFFNEETIRRYGLTPKDKTYQQLMTKIKDNVVRASLRDKKNGRKNATIEEFNDLISSLEAFNIVSKGVDELASERKEGLEYSLHLDFLKKVVSGPATPILMDVLKWTEGTRSTDIEILRELNKILNDVEGLLARRLLGGIKPQQLRSLLSNLPKKLREGVAEIDKKRECTVANLQHYRKLLNSSMISWGPDRFPTDAALLSNPLRDVYQATGKKLSLFSVLWELERILNSEFREKKIPNSLGKNMYSYTIEHVLPQGTKLSSDDTYIMDSAWNKDWDEWKVADTETNFFKCVHSIGNLTILTNSANAHVSNDRFAVKKESYKKLTRIAITDDIKEAGMWTPAEIEQRSIRLLNLALKRWPYPQA